MAVAAVNIVIEQGTDYQKRRYYYDVVVTSCIGKKSKVVDEMVLINPSESI
jgi:hypothetical protein